MALVHAKLELGLERILLVLAALGDPQRDYPCIHVAGTNGKGSVCAMVESVLAESGYRVGKFVSPFLKCPRDSVSINKVTLSEDSWTSAVARVQSKCVECAVTLTTFELWTAAAFVAFRSVVDVAVIEVGVGGRGDATNVIPAPAVAVVTSISMDHVELLGPTLADIARHKAGIIKAAGTVVLSPGQSPEVIEVMRDEATRFGARLVEPRLLAVEATAPARGTRTAEEASTGLKVPIALKGSFQVGNTTAALAALRVLQGSGAFDRITDASIIAGFAAVRWPGRLEQVQLRIPSSAAASNAGDAAPRSLDFLLDGGHNEGALPLVRETIDDLIAARAYQRVVFVFGGTSSRPLESTLPHLIRPGDTVLGVPFSIPEGMPWVKCHSPASIVAAVEAIFPGNICCATACESLADALSRISGDPELSSPSTLRVCCGSLYLVADAYRSAVVDG